MRQRVDDVNEGQTSTVRFELFDRDGAEAEPLSARYRIDDPNALAAVRAWTTAGFSNNVVEIEVTAAENTPIADGAVDEQREVTMEATYAAGETFVDSALYNVRAARFWP